MSLDLALSSARSGLSHVNRQLAQVASNVANSATPGYTRKAVGAEANAVGGLSGGVRSTEVTRAVDAALVTRMDAARAERDGMAAGAAILARIDTAHGPTGASIGDLTGALGDGLVSLRADPADPLLQSAAAAAAAALARRYNAVSDAIGQARQEAQDGMVADVGALNGAVRQVGALSREIVALRSMGLGTAELEDKRDLAVSAVSSVMQVRALPQADGGVVLVSSGGLTIPLHGPEGPFSLAAATVGAQAYHGGGGTLPGVMLGTSDVTGRLGDGTLAARATLRDRTLPLMQAEMDVSAAGLAARTEAQGLRLFTGAGGAVPDPALPYPTGGAVGFAGAIRVNPAVEADPALVRDGTHAVTAAPGGPGAFTPNPAGGPAGFTTLLDRLLDRALGAEASPGNPHPPFATTGLGPDGLLTSPLRAARTLGDQAAQVVASQSAAHAVQEERGRAAGELLGVLEGRFAERSGVDMDKELAAMVTLQTAYAANARVVSTVQSMYDTLMQAMR